jgi:unsaturated rhamnogalacturonyl hydrolase
MNQYGSERERVAGELCRTVLDRPEGFSSRWHYEDGLAALAMDCAGRALRRPDISARALSAIATLVGPDGSIAGYKEEDYNLDQINPGRCLFRLYESTQEKRFETALRGLRGQLERQPRCPSGGFWHKKIYPNQMWLDGLYMAQPFLARYASVFGRPQDYEEVLRQFDIMERSALDPATGLLRHGCDESRSMPWADPATCRSPHAWGRSMGWFMMALVDSAECFPERHPGKKALAEAFERRATAIISRQDPQSGLWRQVLDRGEGGGNYLETSASAMFCYSFLKAERLGMMAPGPAGASALAAFEGLERVAFAQGPDGFLHVDGSCAVAGLGGSPYRSGSFEYYVGEPRKRDDFKGLGPCILAALEVGGIS